MGDGVVKPPRYLPPIFRDLSGLAIWLAYSTFFTRLGADETSVHVLTRGSDDVVDIGPASKSVVSHGIWDVVVGSVVAD